MSTITFKALINDIHYDPKKGTLKIQLIAANYVSLDKLATLGPQDENVQVTLESAQTRLAGAEDLSEERVLALKAAEEIKEKAMKRMEEEAEAGVGDPIYLGEEEKEKLKAAAEKLKAIKHMEADELAGKIVTEFPTPEEPEDEGDAGEHGGTI
jgi:hypothetical protein